MSLRPTLGLRLKNSLQKIAGILGTVIKSSARLRVKQETLAATGFEKHGKPSRRDAFLSEMDRITPWAVLCDLIHPVYPTGDGDLPRVMLERMLRIYFLQQWFNLSDIAVKEALQDSEAMRRFAGIDLGIETIPDETRVYKFRHLLERHELGNEILDSVNEAAQFLGVRL